MASERNSHQAPWKCAIAVGHFRRRSASHFDRFYRADPSRSDIDGAGLGLAIAKWIAEMHHADLTVTSELRKGTVFQLVLPVCAIPGSTA